MSSTRQPASSTRKTANPAAATTIVTLTETYSVSRTWTHTRSSTQSPSATTTPSNKHGLMNTRYGVGPIIGIAVGAFLFIALVLSSFHSCRRRLHFARKRPRGSKLESEKKPDPEMASIGFLQAKIESASITPVSANPSFIPSQRRASSEVSASGFVGYPPLPLPSPHEQFFALHSSPPSSDKGGVGATDGWLARNSSPPTRHQSLPSSALPLPAPRAVYSLPAEDINNNINGRPLTVRRLTPPPAHSRSKKRRDRKIYPSAERPPSPSLSHRSRTRRGSSAFDTLVNNVPVPSNLDNGPPLPRSYSEGRAASYHIPNPPPLPEALVEHSLARSPSEDVGYALYMASGRKPYTAPGPSQYPTRF